MLSQYSVAFLDQMINVATASTVVAYVPYAISPDGDRGVGADPMLWTVPLVLFGIFRYLYLVYQRPAEHSPTESLNPRSGAADYKSVVSRRPVYWQICERKELLVRTLDLTEGGRP